MDITLGGSSSCLIDYLNVLPLTRFQTLTLTEVTHKEACLCVLYVSVWLINPEKLLNYTQSQWRKLLNVAISWTVSYTVISVLLHTIQYTDVWENNGEIKTYTHLCEWVLCPVFLSSYLSKCLPIINTRCQSNSANGDTRLKTSTLMFSQSVSFLHLPFSLWHFSMTYVTVRTCTISLGVGWKQRLLTDGDFN